MPDEQDDDLLDGCGHVLESTDYDDEETEAYRALFPGDLDEDVGTLAQTWRTLFEAGI